MFARSSGVIVLLFAAACSGAESPPPALPPPAPTEHIAPQKTSAPLYCAYEPSLSGGILSSQYIGTLLHGSCRYGHIVEALRSRVAYSCRAPFRNLRDTLRAEEDLDEVHDCLVPAARDKLAEALANTVETVVAPACVWKPTEPASANPRASECPLPEDLYVEVTTPEERARKARGEAVVPASYRSIPAGVLAFVSAWSTVDRELFARLHQRALLVCDWNAEVEYTADHECLVNGQPEVRP